MAEDFKGRLRESRKAWGTLTALAEEVDTTYNTLQTWKTDPPEKPDAYLLARISSVLGKDALWLLTGEGDPGNGAITGEGQSSIDTTPTNNVRSTVSEEAITKGGIMSGARLERYIRMLEDEVDRLEAENGALRENPREAQGEK